MINLCDTEAVSLAALMTVEQPKRCDWCSLGTAATVLSVTGVAWEQRPLC